MIKGEINMMTWQEFEHEKDTLHGEINRMCVSDNITEINHPVC